AGALVFGRAVQVGRREKPAGRHSDQCPGPLRPHCQRCMRPRGTYSKGELTGRPGGSQEISSTGAASRHMRNSLDIEGRPADTRVVVAMSGGVDSAVTAALLKAEGYDVVGVTLQLYDHGAATHRKGARCAGQDVHDARMVAGSIGI